MALGEDTKPLKLTTTVTVKREKEIPFAESSMRVASECLSSGFQRARRPRLDYQPLFEESGGNRAYRGPLENETCANQKRSYFFVTHSVLV